MKIIAAYIAKQVLIATIFVCAVVVAVSFIIGLLKELHDIGMGDYGLLSAMIYVLLLLPHTVYQFFPLFVLIGAVLGLGTLAAQHELIVMRLAGFSIRQIILSVMYAALLLMLIMGLIGECLAPYLDNLAQKRKSSAVSHGQVVAARSGIWIHDGNNFLHIERILGNYHLEGITRYEFDHQHRLLAAYYADTSDFIDKQWVFNQVAKTVFGVNKTHSEQIARMQWHLNLTPNVLKVGMIEPEAMSLVKLNQYSRYLIKNHLQASRFQFEFWQRAFQPLAVIIMILLALPLVFISPRSMHVGRRIVIGILIGFAFYILVTLLGQFCIVFQFPPMIAALLPLLLFFLIGCGLVSRIK